MIMDKLSDIKYISKISEILDHIGLIMCNLVAILVDFGKSQQSTTKGQLQT